MEMVVNMSLQNGKSAQIVQKTQPETKPLDGIRVLLNWWILVFHAVFFLMYFVTEEEAQTLFARLSFAEHGYLAVDGFFILTGYLMGLQLLKTSPRTSDGNSRCEFNLATYYHSRFLRIMPAYFLLYVLHCLVINRAGSYRSGLVRLESVSAIFDKFFPGAEMVDNGCANTPSNIFHLNMFMPFNGCFMHAWSVGVQYHAYLWLPALWKWLHLYRPSNLLSFTLTVELGTALIRFLGQIHHSTFVKGSMLGSALELFWYSNTLLRVHTIVVGLGLAYLSTRTSLPVWLKSGTAWAKLAHFSFFILVAAFISCTIGWKEWFGDYRYVRSAWNSFYVVFLAVGGVVSAVLFSYLVLCAVHRIGVFSDHIGLSPSRDMEGLHGRSLLGAGLSRLLASSRWDLLADLSYVAYLVHPLVYNIMFASPWLLYPPSNADQAPWSLVMGAASVVKSNATFVPPSQFAAPLQAWFSARDTVMPHGQSLSLSGSIVLSFTVMCMTYLFSFLVVVLMERPCIRLLQSNYLDATVRKFTWWYSVVVMAAGLIVHVVGTVVVGMQVQPELETWLVNAFVPPNVTGSMDSPLEDL
jgi:peptidoglycan/LPS O-acetylase OafA/YrhL